MRAGGAGAVACRGRGWDTWLGRYLGPCLLGKLGPLGKMGETTPPCRGGDSVPQLCSKVGTQRALFHTWGHPRLPGNGTSAKVLLSGAPQGLLLSSPPRQPLPLPPSSPTHRGPGICVNATSSSSCRLGKPLGCPEAQCFHLYNGTPPRQHHGRRFWGATGQGQCTPAQCPEHRGVPGTGVLAPCWVGKGGTGTHGDTRGDPDVRASV